MREFWGLEEAGVRADEEALQILAQLSAKHAIVWLLIWLCFINCAWKVQTYASYRPGQFEIWDVSVCLHERPT